MSQLRQGLWWSGLHGNRSHVDIFFNTLPCEHARKPLTSCIPAPTCLFALGLGRPGIRGYQTPRKNSIQDFELASIEGTDNLVLFDLPLFGPPAKHIKDLDARRQCKHQCGNSADLPTLIRVQTWGCERRWKRQFFATGYLLQKLLLSSKPQARDPLTEQTLVRIPGTDSSTQRPHLSFHFSPPAPQPRSDAGHEEG